MKLTQSIHQLKIPFEITLSPTQKIPRFVNVFFIIGKKIHLVDSGVKDGLVIIQQYIQSLGRDISEIESLLLTHSHPDHIGAASEIQKISECKIFAHQVEKEWIEDIDLQFSKRPVPGFYNLVGGSVQVDFIVENQEIIELEEDIHIKVIHTPGHSEGSVSFYFEEEQTLFSGDAVLLPDELPVYENVADYLDSLEKIEKQKPEILLSAWDGSKRYEEIQIVIENSKNYIQKIQTAVDEVAKYTEDTDSIGFCTNVLEKLGLPVFLANPLLLKSFQANIQYKIV